MDSVVNLIVFTTVEGEHVIVFRQGIHEGSGRRNNDIVLAIHILIEHPILTEVVRAGSRVALDKPHCKRELVGVARTGLHVLRLGRKSRILLRQKRVVARNLFVLLSDVGIVGVNLVVGIVQRVVVADTNGSPCRVGHDCGSQRSAERRTANDVAPVNIAVVDVVVAVVADAVPVAIPIAGREGVNPVAEAVVVMRVIEAVRRPAVDIYVTTVTRMLWAEVVARRLRLAVVVIRTRIVADVASRAVAVCTSSRTCRRQVPHGRGSF